MHNILFVCTGNICRSPTADGVARYWAQRLGLDHAVRFDSAGTHAWHTGEPPDPRSQKVAKQRGYDLSRLRSRPVVPQDFARFDRLLAMDRSHLVWLQRECPPAEHHKLALFLPDRDVPDPYYGGPEGFAQVLDLCEEGVRALFDEFR